MKLHEQQQKLMAEEGEQATGRDARQSLAVDITSPKCIFFHGLIELTSARPLPHVLQLRAQ